MTNEELITDLRDCIGAAEPLTGTAYVEALAKIDAVAARLAIAQKLASALMAFNPFYRDQGSAFALRKAALAAYIETQAGFEWPPRAADAAKA